MSRLEIPNDEQMKSSMWVDEAIWGHRLHDEQIPWYVFLEFLNIYFFRHRTDADSAFHEENPNAWKYQSAKRLELRHILFNNPFLNAVRMSEKNSNDQWQDWQTQIGKTARIGEETIDFSYLQDHFQSFEDFCEVVGVLTSSAIGMNRDTRWSSKFVFPYGEDCLFEDFTIKGQPDRGRRFFGRTGELLYMMLCRSKHRDEIQETMSKIFVEVNAMDSRWNLLVKSLQPNREWKDDLSSPLSVGYLPYAEHPCYDLLAEDWLAILRLRLSGFEKIPHLINLIGFHLLRYQLYVSRQILDRETDFSGIHFVCEIVASKKTSVREKSWESYQANNCLSEQAIDAYIVSLLDEKVWDKLRNEDQRTAIETAKSILQQKFFWDSHGDDTITVDELRNNFVAQAQNRHGHHFANIHRVYGREIGLISRRGTNKHRYAPTDSLLKTFLIANVHRRMELKQFLESLYNRYGLVFGPTEAKRGVKVDYDQNDFESNVHRLEQRLCSLGLLCRLSDGCAYVLNTCHGEAS